MVDGHTVDVGGQWVGPTQNRVLGLARELGIETYPQFDRGKKVVELGEQRRTYRGLLPWVGLRPLAELGWTMARLELMARRISCADPSRASAAASWDATSVERWLDDNVKTQQARGVLEIATQMVFAGEPRDLSLLFFLFYLRSGGSFVRLTSIRGGAQAQRLVGGAQALSQTMAASLQDALTLEAPVRSIEHDGDRVVVRHDGGEAIARRVILAVPPALTAEIDMNPPRSAARQRIETGMPMGSVVKCIVEYARPFWRERGYSGEAISDGSPIRATFDACNQDGSFCGLVAFVIADGAREFGQLPEAERKDRVVEHLTRLFGTQAKKAKAYTDMDWSQERFSKGCYVGLMRPGVLTEAGRALRAPANLVHFAGTETATRWCGYFDGAIEAGERAADEVLAALS